MDSSFGQKKASMGAVGGTMDLSIDLSSEWQLKQFGFTASQLWGPIGKLTLEQLFVQIHQNGHEHVVYRHPLRPGLVCRRNLSTGEDSPSQRLSDARLADKLSPGTIESWCRLESQGVHGEHWEMIYPPVGSNSLEYATALEWLIGRFPQAVVAWVELGIVYESEFKSKYALDHLMEECRRRSPCAGVVFGVFGYDFGGQTDFSLNSGSLG